MEEEKKKKEIKEVFSRFIEKIYPSEKEMETILLSRKKLRVYYGIDPTGPHLHLGHSLQILLLKRFQNWGHKVILLIGDFTAQIGDPTGKLSTRRVLTEREVKSNYKNYKKQVEKILNFEGKNKAEIRFNSEWYKKFSFKDGISLMTKITYSQLIKRSMFQRRIQEKKEIYFHELIYPLLQGYDSVALKADVEIGGNDQTFNMLIGRDLVKEYQKREKFVIATKLLENPKTKKKLMSKSEGGIIALDEKPLEMYGKIMALSDEVIIPLLTLCTEVPLSIVKEYEREMRQGRINPRNVKAFVAREIVKMYHGERKAIESEREFEKIFRKKEIPQKIEEIKLKRKKVPVLNFLLSLGLVSSKSEAKRLILQKGVKINGRELTDWKTNILPEDKMIVQVGKRKFKRVRII